MKHLSVYEIGVDPLPVEGSEVFLITSNCSFGMFEDIGSQEGEVVYMHGDIADTLEEAIKLGGYITTKWEDIRDWDGESLSISIEVEGVGTMTDGDKWMYVHEYLSTVSDLFPFQSWSSYTIALREGWIEEVSYAKDDTEFDTPRGDIRFDESVVLYDGKTYHLTWCGVGDHKTLHVWKEVVNE